MLGYREFVELSASGDSEERSKAAHFAARTFASHDGPADEQAALYAALVSFLDDPSVKVRAALAYGLLHEARAPRPVMVSLLHDAPIIARAVAQYSPVVLDADLFPVVRSADIAMLDVLVLRKNLSLRLAQAILARDIEAITLKLIERIDLQLPSGMLDELARQKKSSPDIRGALLKRPELSAVARYQLIEEVGRTLSDTRIVRGSMESARMERVLRNAQHAATSAIGEREATAGRADYAAHLVNAEKVTTRLLLHALTHGHVMFFADCLGQLAKLPRAKVFTLLNTGSRAALNALLSRCGLPDSVRNLLARMVFYARAADLADDIAARHFVVTSLVEELIAEHSGEIPPDLEECFAYLNEQNVTLARNAARGVMPSFAADAGERALPVPGEELTALPAA